MGERKPGFLPFLFTMVFFGVPILFSWYASHQDLTQAERQAVLRARSRLEFIAMHLDGLVGSREHFTEVLRRTLKSQVDRHRDWNWLKKRLAGVRKVLPGVFRFIGLDKHGKPVPGLQECDLPLEHAPSFVQDYLAYWDGKPDRLEMSLPTYRRFLGPMAGKGRVGDFVNRVDHSSGLPDQRYVYVSPPLTDGVLIAFFKETPRWEAINLRSQVPAFLQFAPHVRFRICRIDNPDNVLLDRLGEDLSKYLGRALPALGTSDRTKVELGSASWMRIRLGTEHQIILATRLLPQERRELAQRRRSIDGSALALFLAGCSLGWLAGALFPHIFRSIRWQALLLLLFVVLVSLCLLRISAQAYLVEMQRNLIRATFDNLQDQVRELDNGYPAFLRSLKNTLAAHFRFTSNDPTRMAREASYRLGCLARDLGAGDFELFDPDGKFALHFPSLPDDGPMPNQPLKKLFTMSRSNFARAMRELNGTPEDPGEKSKGKGPLLEMGGDLLGINFDLMIAQAMRSLGEMISIEFGNSSMRGIFIPLRDLTGRVRFLGFLGWNASNLYRLYVQTRIQEQARHRRNIQLLAFQPDRKYRIPTKSPYHYIMSQTAHFLDRSGEVLRAHLRPNRRGKLLVGSTARLLPGYSFFAVTSEKLVEEQCARVRAIFFALGLGILLLSLVAGNALIRSLWAPVTDLERGVMALDERRFRDRVPVRNPDEFGILAKQFNGLLESLSDLEIAETLQRTLFPQSKLVQGSWEIKGRCVPTSKVGGDFYDYFPLPGERIGFVLGDVSGHGVGAALVVGMAKAFFAHPERLFEPATCLSHLSALILSTLKQKKMMTCLVGIFEPATGRLQAANAGQTYPIIVSPERAEFLKLPGFPLGFRNKRGYPLYEGVLRPDQTLILYTDYLVEAETAPNIQLGFSKLERDLPDIVSSDATATEQSLRDWHGKQVHPGPAQDDLTLMVLQCRKDHMPHPSPDRSADRNDSEHVDP